ncbi:MAG: 16S rRNA (uracil(1498)-N(3))-methyltransferase [Nannocystaceae bacterium]
MNLILLEPGDFVAPDRVVLRDRRCQHVRKIHRAVPGDELRVGKLGGAMGTGRVQRLERGHLEMTLLLDRDPPPPVDLTLAVALPRPHSLQKLLQYATAMGVKRFALFHSARVEKSYWDSSALAPDALRRHLMLGLEQGVDTILPEVSLCRGWGRFIDEVLPTLGTPIFVAHPDGRSTLGRGELSPAVLVIGPEGGLLADEIQRLRSVNGVRTVSLGRRVLRVEAAVVALLARLF